MKRQLGFTLIELLVAATIIALLTTIGLVSFQITNTKARDGKRKADLEQVRAALELYKSDDSAGAGRYPNSNTFSAMEGTLQSSNYLSAPVPSDPKNDQTQGLVYVYTVNNTQTSYCLCAKLEQNSAGNTAAENCSAIGTNGTGQYYCLANP
ncbi:hypothetical protein C5B42_04865 [Candidatus Cerribacteria bacterium 'Amazon FNV 2010 28 9']|uniref:Type II secretion system protein GspG C-terminal domain-containing protein n=1 Tax=Candidatus Cerribacteria bacterium 'Amazon FNV 2010 28 9' TaxID=2081795 RepID=A0A317JNY8_9BACT|nr:MAG: hypothetical protein C5B42_04865 [Candidatus Cerribacteria bacterium 'Amazon FNV 2010 28 9']